MNRSLVGSTYPNTVTLTWNYTYGPGERGDRQGDTPTEEREMEDDDDDDPILFQLAIEVWILLRPVAAVGLLKEIPGLL